MTPVSQWNVKEISENNCTKTLILTKVLKSYEFSFQKTMIDHVGQQYPYLLDSIQDLRR